MMAFLLRIVLTNVVASILLFLLVDYSWTYLSLPTQVGLANPIFHHTLKPNLSLELRSPADGTPYPFRTNSLGFKDSEVRSIPFRAKKNQRLVFIGDSFTEGQGLPWEDTFVGKFAKHFPDLEVLNAGRSSYSPSIYYRKIKWLLDSGYKFDHVLVYVDVSDIQDEAREYREDSNGNIIRYESLSYIDYQKTVADSLRVGNGHALDPLIRRIKDWLHNHFSLSALIWSLAKDPSKLLVAGTEQGETSKPRDLSKLIRSYWTVDNQLPGYGELGVEGGINKAASYMQRLSDLLHAKGIKLSVAVYPWPDQMDFGTEHSRQVSIWRQWCKKNACTNFIDHFPDFFEFKLTDAKWREKIFLREDIHYSEFGNSLIASRLISSFSKFE